MSSNNGLENGDRELGHLFCYYMSCKTLSTILLGECAYFITGISGVQIWSRHHSFLPFFAEVCDLRD